MSWRTQPRDKRGRWTKTGGGVVAVIVALVVGAGGAGTTVGASAGAAGSGTAAGRSVGTNQGGATRVRARDRSTAQMVRRLESRGLQVTERGVDADDDCAAHSYGQVRTLFVRQPCDTVYRALLEVRDGRAAAVVAVAWVDMPDEAQAREYQQLVDRHGTGNITELTTQGVRPTSVRWTGERYRSARDGATVVNLQAEPLGRAARATQLAERVATTAIG
jgi:hypothetical protein